MFRMMCQAAVDPIRREVFASILQDEFLQDESRHMDSGTLGNFRGSSTSARVPVAHAPQVRKSRNSCSTNPGNALPSA
jgi:hypothetical protein